MDSRKRGRNVEYLIRWKGYGEEEDSWEPLKNIRDAKEALEIFKKEGKPVCIYMAWNPIFIPLTLITCVV